jgi:very-short-patch-repair endonuclease
MQHSVDALTARQHGLISRQQAIDCGLTRHQIQTNLRRGSWRRAAPAVYRLAGAPEHPHTALHAVSLSSGGTASHRSAAHLLELIERPPSRPEITIGRTARFRGAAIVHHSRDLIRKDVTTVDGVRTTNATRTLLDLGAVVSASTLEGALHLALRSRLTHYDPLVARFFQLAKPGRNGIGAMRALLVSYDATMAPAESNLETRLLAILRDAGAPPPTRQHRVTARGDAYRLDVAYPAARIAIEGDGFGVHSARDVFEGDRVRQNNLVLDGWLILRFTWRQLCARPDWVVEQVFAALAMRAAA